MIIILHVPLMLLALPTPQQGVGRVLQNNRGVGGVLVVPGYTRCQLPVTGCELH